MYATSFVFVIDVCMLIKQNNQLYNQNLLESILQESVHV